MNSSTTTPPPTALSAMNGDKLSGQLIIKAQLGDDIRKMMIHNEDLTLNELVLMMERVFSGKISNSDEITIKYLDDDGDKITLLNDSDLTVALHFHKLLRLFVFVNGNEQTNTNSSVNLKKNEDSVDTTTIRNELNDIKTSVQTILDRLQVSSNDVQTNELDSHKQQQQQQISPAPDNSQSNSTQHATNNHQTAPTVDTQQVESTDLNKNPSPNFPQTQMPIPQYVPPGYNNEHQAKTNIFGPPPTIYPSMPSLPNNAMPRFPSATTPNSNTPPPPSSLGQSSAFIGQQVPPPAQQTGFYGQQQNLLQQRPAVPGFNPYNPQQPAAAPPSNSAPATINPSYIHPPPPSMPSQQPHGNYAPQNAYFNPMQQYPKTS